MRVPYVFKFSCTDKTTWEYRCEVDTDSPNVVSEVWNVINKIKKNSDKLEYHGPAEPLYMVEAFQDLYEVEAAYR